MNTYLGVKGTDGKVLRDVTDSNGLPTTLTGSKATSITTHNAVSVGAGISSPSAWIDTNGYSELSVTLLSDGATANTVTVNWSDDGVTVHGSYILMPSGTLTQRAETTPTKLRYARVVVFNGDTASHTMTTKSYLKA